MAPSHWFPFKAVLRDHIVLKKAVLRLFLRALKGVVQSFLDTLTDEKLSNGTGLWEWGSHWPQAELKLLREEKCKAWQEVPL